MTLRVLLAWQDLPDLKSSRVTKVAIFCASAVVALVEPDHCNSRGPEAGFGCLCVMANDPDPIHVDGEDARAGATPHITRYVLAISLILVIVIFGVLLFRPFG